MSYFERDRLELEEILLKNDDVFKAKKRILEILPEFTILDGFEHHNRAHKYNVLDHTFDVVNNVDKDIVLKIAALFHDLGKPYVKTMDGDRARYKGHEEVSAKLAEIILKRLGYDEEFVNLVIVIVYNHDSKLPCDKAFIEWMVVCMQGKENFIRLLKHKVADLNSHAEGYRDLLMPKLEKLLQLSEEVLKDV